MSIISWIFYLCVLIASIQATNTIMVAKIDLVLDWQTEIKEELVTNSQEHKRFASISDFIERKFNLK